MDIRSRGAIGSETASEVYLTPTVQEFLISNFSLALRSCSSSKPQACYTPSQYPVLYIGR